MASSQRGSTSKPKPKVEKPEKRKKGQKAASNKNANSKTRIKSEAPSKISIPELTELQRDELLIKYVYSSGSEPELPEDGWNDDGDGEYEVEKIIDEVVDMTGKHKYKIQWANWKRKSDGSNTTWGVEADFAEGAPTLLRDWEKEKTMKILERRRKYETTGGYPISLFGHGCVTRFNTTLMELGLLKDQNPHIPAQPESAEPLGDWDAEVEAVKAQAAAWVAENKGKIKTTWDDSAVEDGGNNQGTSEEIEFVPSPNALRRRRSASKSPSKLPNKSPLKKSLLQKRRLDGSDYSLSSGQDKSGGESLNPLFPHRHKRRHTLDPTEIRKAATSTKNGTGTKTGVDAQSAQRRRKAIQAKWDQETKRVGAASITIVNELDDEAVPASINPDVFEYVESGPYRWDGPSQDDYIFGCSCTGDCRGSPNCECQHDEHDGGVSLHPSMQGRQPPYDSKGLYILSSGKVHRETVIECNAKCTCASTCRNRVAQRPRDIALEIFKSPNHGWAVRSTVPIPKGKVLGLFMGELMEVSGEDSDGGWTYNLDWHHDSARWKVSSEFYGNWSRFLNHSCYANLQAYGVVFDSVRGFLEDDRHRLAFVAVKDIPARTELTVNYDPARYNPSSASKRKKCCKYGGCVE